MPLKDPESDRLVMKCINYTEKRSFGLSICYNKPAEQVLLLLTKGKPIKKKRHCMKGQDTKNDGVRMTRFCGHQD